MNRMTRRSFLETAGLAATVPVLGAVTAQAQSREGSIAVEKNVVFGKGGEGERTVDILLVVKD